MSMILPTFREEKKLSLMGYQLIAGVDEAGRGPLAGPVVAGAVVLPPDWPRRQKRTFEKLAENPLDLIRDSKLLNPAQRGRAYDIVMAHAVAWGVGISSVEIIDTLGIVPATRMAMSQAIAGLGMKPQALLVDFVDLSDEGLPCHALIDGDALCFSIAAASIVAKVTRDRMMQSLEGEYPGYGFAQHKGYATPEHQRALAERGPCQIHRRSFEPIRSMVLNPRLF
jgi:ribonuclease HII